MAGGRRAEVNGYRLRYVGRRPAGASEAHSEVDVLAVEHQTLVEATDLLPRSSAVGATTTRRSGEDGTSRRDVANRASAKAREPGQCSVCHQAHAVDRSLVRSEEQRGCGTELGILFERRDEPVEEVWARFDIVVQQHDHLAAAGVDSP